MYIFDWTFMLCSIDKCHNKVSADRDHVTILQVHV